jgi:hypothetical protein
VNNLTKKIKLSKKKYEEGFMKIPELLSDKKNDNDDKNNNEIKEPDNIIFHFRVIAMDYEIYNIKKNGQNNKNAIDQLLKKKYIIDFYLKNTNIYEMISEGKIYQLKYLNLEYKNHNNLTNPNKKFKDYNENTILIKFNDKSMIDEISQPINYKTEKEYIETIDIINKSLNLSNSIDIGKLFIENSNDDKYMNSDDYMNKEFSLSGIYSGYLDKKKYKSISQNKSDEKETNEEKEEYIVRYIFLSIGMSRVAIIKLHNEEFFFIDVNSNSIQDKFFTCNDIIFKEILYFDNDDDQPKITGRKKLKKSIPLLVLETNVYSSINFGSTKGIEQRDLYKNYKKENKKLIEMLSEIL